jgi:hypothetical protein
MAKAGCVSSGCRWSDGISVRAHRVLGRCRDTPLPCDARYAPTAIGIRNALGMEFGAFDDRPGCDDR